MQPRCSGLGLDQRNFDQMLVLKPDLELVSAKDLAHYKIVRAVISKLRRAPCKLADFAENHLVCFQQA